MDDFTKMLLGLHNHRMDTARDEIVRCPLGWPGSKSRSLKNLMPHLPVRKIWVDVFGGSGCVTCARQDSELEVYNDRYSGVTAFYRVMQNKEKYEKLRERLELTVFSKEEFHYCLETWENVNDDVERAARWYYMHQCSFAKQGEHWGRVRFSRGDGFGRVRGHLPDFPFIHKRFRNIQIENMDWRQVLKDYDHPEAVFYLDPPYTKCSKNHYKVDRLVMLDHQEILEAALKCKGFVAISGFSEPEYLEAPFDHIYQWEVYHSMNGVGMADQEVEYGGREKRIECLYIKEAA